MSNFGINCFNDMVLKERLNKEDYVKYQEILNNNDVMDETFALVLAEELKKWAIEKGVTFFCHWFHPFSQINCEKKENFINQDINSISKLNTKQLLKREHDASSFLNGGLRTTYKAKGYSCWDYTSPCFIIDKTLYIPSYFISYSGDALDEKLPLLKSIYKLERQAKEIINFLENKDISITPMVGLEQEFFLIDLDDYLKRRDLKLCNKTLFSNSYISDTHYLKSLSKRVKNYLNEANEEFGKLGIQIQTFHSEVSPCQFEICPSFNKTNISIDQNILIMDTLSKIAYNHNFVCLLNELPFKGVNGSGKHNNFSLLTSGGINLFDPNEYKENINTFLLFICAFIKAIDEYSPLIALSSLNPENNNRLGKNEAPSNIISISLGEKLELFLNKLCNENMKDFLINDDRNRTSPITFTGNKFEFRMLGASMNASFLNTIINIALANSLKHIYQDLTINKLTPKEIAKNILSKHKKIIFNGNNYSNEWKEEAKKRDLTIISSFQNSIKYLKSLKDDIYNKNELNAIINRLYELNNKTYEKEAITFSLIIEQDIIPAYTNEINSINNLCSNTYLKNKVIKLNNAINEINNNNELLKNRINNYKKMKSLSLQAKYIEKNIVPLMNKLREIINSSENIISSKNYPYPRIEDILNNKKL